MTNKLAKTAVSILLAVSPSALQGGSVTDTPAARGHVARNNIGSLVVTAAPLHREADQLLVVVRDPERSWVSDLPELDMMKEKLNAMGREIHTLDAERQNLPAWEQDTLAKTLPLLEGSVANLNRAIRFYNDNRSHLWEGRSYQTCAENLYRDSGQIEKILKTDLKLDSVQHEEERLKPATATAGAERRSSL